MVKFLARRFAQMFVLFVAFLTIVFFLLHAMPGDISNQLIGNPNIPPEQRQILRETLGLDKPLPEQYLTYITNFFRGELGVSFTRYPQDVSTVIGAALPRTLVLFLAATLLAFWLGFKSGKLIAWGRETGTEKAFIVGGVFLQTVFYPWFALVMLWFFGSVLGWFPLGRFIDANLWRGADFNSSTVFNLLILSAFVAVAVYALGRVVFNRVSPDPMLQGRMRRILAFVVVAVLVLYWYLSPMRSFAWDIVHHTMLPVFTLAAVAFGATMLLTRSAMLETLGEDYILTARAKGLPEKVIRDRHAARNAMLPVTTSLVLSLAFVIGGGIVTENIFSWPGMGSLLLEAVQREDIPLAIGTLSIVGVLALVGHLVADVLYTILDPRIRIA
ncbi:MAG TPA: ABC transporter permease [Acidimicrobiia bacterium]|nr:ABC transporter permease [Acidimicrobiia bacterium]